MRGLGTLNLGSREVANLMQRGRIAALCPQETRWKGKKASEIGEWVKLFYNGEDTERNGVGIVVAEFLKDSIGYPEHDKNDLHHTIEEAKVLTTEYYGNQLSRTTIEGNLPDDRRKSTTVPILKQKRDASECSSYRGITLISQTVKFYEPSLASVSSFTRRLTLCEQAFLARLASFALPVEPMLAEPAGPALPADAMPASPA
ncbi:unnamed protein product [Heligmosomoides polygyrus]|uniref:Uncharacterized protein n=1 Tax=Heligmosomoides polygyrus TaxID=6339 RepID=A0A183FGD6_HELPZ|nr:unnamed protein product [Heligmosomoides polygyrus]